MSLTREKIVCGWNSVVLRTTRTSSLHPEGPTASSHHVSVVADEIHKLLSFFFIEVYLIKLSTLTFLLWFLLYQQIFFFLLWISLNHLFLSINFFWVYQKETIHLRRCGKSNKTKKCKYFPLDSISQNNFYLSYYMIYNVWKWKMDVMWSLLNSLTAVFTIFESWNIE